MSAETKTPANDELRIGLLVSLLGHAAIVSVFAVKALVFTNDEHANLQALRVDLVALPDKNPPPVMPAPTKPEEPEAKAPSKPEPKAEPAKPEPKAEPAKSKPAPAPVPTKKEPEAINLNKVKSKQQQALEALKRMQALDKIKDEVSSDERQKRVEAAKAAAKRAGAVKIKGNVLAAGSDLQGLDQLQHEEYRSALDAHIKPFWKLNSWLAGKKLHAQALIRIDAKGQIISKQLVKASGNRDFDDSVLETIDNAAPMPAPPEKFVNIVASDGIFIEFGSADAATE